MSKYATYKIKKLKFWNNESYFDFEFAGYLFTNEDLEINNNVRNDDDEDAIPYDEYKYKTTVKKAIERLDAIGITEKNIEDEFNQKILDCMDYEGFFEHLNIPVEEWKEKRIERTKKYVSFLKWKNALKKFVTFEMENGNINSTTDVSSFFRKNNECEKIIYYSMVNDLDEYAGIYGVYWDFIDPIKVIRIILSFCSLEEIIELDVTELIGYTYNSISELKIDDPIQKNIVLVEGTSDKLILEFALKMIYPHLENLYYFMDFEFGDGTKRPGGADSIASNMKAFIASRLKANFIALFDNDTIGVQKRKQLEHEIKVIPHNIRILNYPSISEVKSYPTIAPNGKIINDDINCRACSVELYLPDEFIKDENEMLYPIIWTSLIHYKINGQSFKSYQGVIDQKDHIKERIVSYINDVEKGSCVFDPTKWGKMIQLLESLVNAFK